MAAKDNAPSYSDLMAQATAIEKGALSDAVAVLADVQAAIAAAAQKLSTSRDQLQVPNGTPSAARSNLDAWCGQLMSFGTSVTSMQQTLSTVLAGYGAPSPNAAPGMPGS